MKREKKSAGKRRIWVMAGIVLVLAVMILGTKLLETGGTDPSADNPSADPAPPEKTEEEIRAEKLRELREDPLLLLVNKTHALEKDSEPEDLVAVESCVSGVGNASTRKLRKIAADAFAEMTAAAKEEGISILMRTGYRSYSYQDSLYNSYVKKNGQEKADTYSARPGTSEHQTGLALDIGGKSQSYALSRAFGDTKEGKWVAEHAHEYGFIIRYTDGTKDTPGEITGYISEPWHIRYVGREYAEDIYMQGVTLEEYLEVLD